MSDVPNNNNGPKSTMTALDPDVRNRIIEFLRDPELGTIGACFHFFQLEQRGVSRSAFYRYATKIRNQVDLEEAAARIAPDGPDGPDITAVLPQIIARRLLTILLDDEEASAATLHRLTLAYRAAYNVHIALDDRKKKTPPPDPETEAVRAQAFADIREHQARLQREWAELHKITDTQFTDAMDNAHKPARPEISNLQSNPTNTPLVRDSHLAPTPSGITSREPAANPKPTPDAAHSEITNLKSTPRIHPPPRTDIGSRIPMRDILYDLANKRPKKDKRQPRPDSIPDFNPSDLAGDNTHSPSWLRTNRTTIDPSHAPFH